MQSTNRRKDRSRHTGSALRVNRAASKPNKEVTEKNEREKKRLT